MQSIIHSPSNLCVHIPRIDSITLSRSIDEERMSKSKLVEQAKRSNARVTQRIILLLLFPFVSSLFLYILSLLLFSPSHKKLKDRRMGQQQEDQRLARRYFQIQDRCLTVLRILFGVGIPLTIINISFAAVYAWIYANQVCICVCHVCIICMLEVDVWY